MTICVVIRVVSKSRLVERLKGLEVEAKAEGRGA